jgi:membrane fusion protein (multidrug efflux system)
VQPGKTTAVMRVDALPGQDIPCVIEKLYPAVNPVTRTAQAEIRVQNKFDRERRLIALRSGMYASVSLLLEEHKNVIAIDSTLPVRSLDKYIVYVCVADIVRAVPVKLGVSYNGLVEVVEGLEEGQEIVVEGQHRLTDCAAIVRVQNK